ncbi:MAG: hypothetical protein ACE5G8_07440 [Anaerolineae bacterium]
MPSNVTDFAAVQWARKLSAPLETLAGLPATDWEKLAPLLAELSNLKQAGVTLSPAQLAVILQHLHTQQLESLAAAKGGVLVRLTGGGFEYEQFLLKEDGRIPNHKYTARRAS